MLIIKGHYLDGQSALRIDATLQSNNGSGLSLIVGDEMNTNVIAIDVADIRVEPALGNAPREVELGQERLFISDDSDGVDRLSKLTRQNTFPFSMVHRLENNLMAICVFTFAVIGFVWGVAVYGIPSAAKTIAFEMPEYVEGHLSTGLDLLDSTVLDPSLLTADKQAKLHLLFAEHLKGHESLNPKVHFRSGIGANALALPNGDIVFTDALVNLVDNDAQLVAVLFHELGHLKYKHITRRILQDSMITLVVVLLTGDIDSVDLLTGLPTLVVDLAYSREFELEADRYALMMLKESQIPVSTFTDIMQRLADHYDLDDEGDESMRISDFLSTHPNTQERIDQVKAFEE